MLLIFRRGPARTERTVRYLTRWLEFLITDDNRPRGDGYAIAWASPRGRPGSGTAPSAPLQDWTCMSWITQFCVVPMQNLGDHVAVQNGGSSAT